MNTKLTFGGLCLCAGLFAAVLCSAKLPAANHPLKKTKHLTRLNKPVDSGWRQLFNGKDLNGWKQVGPGNRYVENGITGSHGGMGLCYWTREKFGDCVIRVVYKMQKENSNSGVFIRIPIEPREAWMPVFYGYEVQIDNHPETSGEHEYHITGSLYSLTKPHAKPGRPGPQWNV